MIAVYRAANNDLDASASCLTDGATLSKMLHFSFNERPSVKLTVDTNDAWVDSVTYYKSNRCDTTNRLRVNEQPVLDTGGVRNPLYSMVFEEFACNKHVRMFDGPYCHLRPLCSAESRSSGLWKVLGKMVAHSIAQCGLGFPFLSLVVYWYIAEGENKSIEYLSIQDVGCDVRSVADKVYKIRHTIWHITV